MPDRVTKGPPGRRGDVNEAIAQPVVSLASVRDTTEPFETLYRRSFRRAYAYAATLLRDRSAAEEVTAQAFERAYRKRASYHASRGTPEAWLFGIVRHAALDELRRLRRRATLEGDPEDLRAEAPPDHAEAVVQRETVRAALAGLDPRDRDLVALKFHAELSNAEIGDLLGLSETNVGTRLHRVMEKLRRECRDAS